MNCKKLEKLHNRLNTIAHDRAGLFDTPIVNEVYKIIEKEREEAIIDFVVKFIEHKGYTGEQIAIIGTIMSDYLSQLNKEEKDE